MINDVGAFPTRAATVQQPAGPEVTVIQVDDDAGSHGSLRSIGARTYSGILLDNIGWLKPKKEGGQISTKSIWAKRRRRKRRRRRRRRSRRRREKEEEEEEEEGEEEKKEEEEQKKLTNETQNNKNA